MLLTELPRLVIIVIAFKVLQKEEKGAKWKLEFFQVWDSLYKAGKQDRATAEETESVMAITQGELKNMKYFKR